MKEGLQVEMLDRLATPWGLVRAGVAPDHPNIRVVTRVYEKTAALPGFRVHGHLEVGVGLWRLVGPLRPSRRLVEIVGGGTEEIAA